MPEPLRLCVWSGPRNVSTALMYSFAQRSDTAVIDEPLYGHYLHVSGAEHPGREVVLAAMENDGERVVRDVILGPCDRPVLFMKQMAHHLLGLDWSFLKQTKNVLLIREPARVIASLAKKIQSPKLRDTGMGFQIELLRQLRELGQEVPVLDAREILLDPKGVLSQFCVCLGLKFEESMLHWQPGPKPADGVWAPHWYRNAHESNGFEPYREPEEVLPPHLQDLLDETRPLYERLRALAIKARSAPEMSKHVTPTDF